MKTKFSWIVLVALANLAAMPLPSGWRVPTARESAQEWRNGKQNRQLLVQADFNGDGKEDVAQFLVNAGKLSYGLFAIVTDKQGYKMFKLDEMDGLPFESLGVTVAPVGTYDTACGKGYWVCAVEEPKTLTLSSPGINYFHYEGANSFFVWNTAKQGFDRIWISD